MGRVLLFAIAGSVVAPLVNFCARPRLARTFPRVAISFWIVIFSYFAFLAVARAAIVWIALASALLWIAYAWRSRVSFGFSKCLPPGSLAILPVAPWTKRSYYTDLSHIHGPIYKTSHFFHPMVCMTNLDSGLRLLKEHDDVRLRSPKVAADRFMRCGFLRGMDPQDHKIYRKMVQSLITPRVLDAWERTISADVSRTLRELAEQSSVYARPAWDRLLFESFSRLFFGIGPESEEFQALENAYVVIRTASDRRISIPWLPSERRVERAFREVSDLVRARRASDCLIAELPDDTSSGDSEEVSRLLIAMVYLAGSDMAGLTQWLVKTACDFPERVRETDARWIVLETLRRHQVEHLYRRILEDIEWEGFRFPKGWLLRICLADAHRDETIFPDAADFQPERFAARTPSQSEFLPFGAFRRSCIGENITHIFAREFLTTLLRDWDVKQIGESHEDYHAWHWTPGSDFRIRVQPK